MKSVKFYSRMDTTSEWMNGKKNDPRKAAKKGKLPI